MTLPRSITVAALAIVLSLVLTGSAFAQNNGIGIGAEAMVAFPKVTNVDEGFDAKTAYGFGLWVGGNKGGIVGFAGEFIYEFKKINADDGTELKQQALEIPAVFHINFGKHSKNGAMGYAIIGPVFTYNVKQESTSATFDPDNFASVDIGVMAGAGFEVARLGIEGRGNWGMKSIVVGSDSKPKTFSFELVGKLRFN